MHLSKTPPMRPDASDAVRAAAQGASTALPALRSDDLFIDTREVLILHGSETYRLRLTSNEKLILTK